MMLNVYVFLQDCVLSDVKATLPGGQAGASRTRFHPAFAAAVPPSHSLCGMHACCPACAAAFLQLSLPCMYVYVCACACRTVLSDVQLRSRPAGRGSISSSFCSCCPTISLLCICMCLNVTFYCDIQTCVCTYVGVPAGLCVVRY
jgi:hypothetical protein